MSLSSHINEKANLIWAIADKLTVVYKPHEYGEGLDSAVEKMKCVYCSTVRYN